VPTATAYDPAAEARYAEAEARDFARRKQKLRRQPIYLIAIINTLVLGIGATASVDLRRLRTPGGVALRWTQAAVFGGCDDYLHFSVPDGPEDRARHELCHDLSAQTAQARTHNTQIGLKLGPVHEAGQSAVVQVTLTRAGTPTVLQLRLVRRSGAWKVLRDADTCASVGCA
jgi:hypothetical protein